jgi:hypothetical protein
VEKQGTWVIEPEATGGDAYGTREVGKRRRIKAFTIRRD